MKKQDTITDLVKFKWVALVAASVIGTGTVFYHIFEKLSWLDAVYFSVITTTTIGYGDIYPTTPIGKVFTIFYALISVGIIAASLNILVKIAAQRRLEKRAKNNKK